MKALLVATVQSHIAQFHKPLIKILRANGYVVDVAARDNLKEKNGLAIENINNKYNVQFERSPFSTKNIGAYRELKKIIDEGEYDIISCNTPVGGLVTRLAARKARKSGSRVLYTAHGFHFYKSAPLKNWLIYYPIEKVMAGFTDTLITITEEDYQLATKKFKADIQHIHGVGVNEQKYLSVTKEENEKFRCEMGYANRTVILCTGELNENKNQSTIIKAVSKLVSRYPDILLLLAGNGPKEEDLKNLVQELHLEDNVKLLGYRTDLEKFTNACDVVASVSFREGLPLNIMEAMICGKPVVASYNRGHRELVQDGVTGYLVNATDIDAITEKIQKILEDTEVKSKMSINSRESIIKYTSENVEKELKKIYIEK